MINVEITKEFNPKVIVFACNWGGYSGADLAGSAGLKYPPNIRTIRLMCSARVDPLFVIEAFLKGVDGVIIVGCHPKFCHYIEGNEHAKIRVDFLKKLLKDAGMEPERLWLEWISASEGAKFADVIKDFTNQLRNLGPSPLSEEKPNSKILARLEAAKVSAENFRLRALVSKKQKLVEEGNVYGEKMDEEDFNKLMEDSISAEYIRSRIRLLIKDEPLSVKDLAARLDLDARNVLRHIVVMRRKGLVSMVRIEGSSPLYKSMEVE